MGFPRRPRAQPVQVSSSESSRSTLVDSQRSAKRVKLEKPPIFDPEDVKVYIVVAKLTPDEVRDAAKTVVANGGKVVTQFEDCTIALSKTRLWNRLKGYLPDHGYESKKIVNMTWLQDCINAEEQLPFTDKYLIHTPSALEHIHLDEDGRRTASASPAPSSIASVATSGRMSEVGEPVEDPPEAPQPMNPTQGTALWKTDRTTPPKWVNKRFACQRWHPLVCINQALLMELKWIRDAHKLAIDERRSATYAKAMAAIKSYPYIIKNRQEAQNILGVGEKIAAHCDEYAKTGKIAAAEKIKNDPRHHVLLEFSKIHGVGASTANELYDKYKCRTMQDVEAIAHILPSMGERSTQHVDEFDMKIPRAEVDEIASIVNEHLQRIIPGAEYTVVGGYRRGKAESNDVDIIFTHPDEAKEKGALHKVLKSLQDAGIVTDILYIAMTDSKRDSSMQHFHASHMDPLDKAFTVWKSPANGTSRMDPIHRRVDLIAAPRKYYACAILGWSGSTTFERDLRLYADKVKGMKFDSGGLWIRANSKEIIVQTEKEIFDVLGLEYIPPEWRNCDV